MIAMIENLFARDSSRNQNQVNLGRISTLQLYLVLFERECNYTIALKFKFNLNVFSSHYNCHCNHI